MAGEGYQKVSPQHPHDIILFYIGNNLQTVSTLILQQVCTQNAHVNTTSHFFEYRNNSNAVILKRILQQIKTKTHIHLHALTSGKIKSQHGSMIQSEH